MSFSLKFKNLRKSLGCNQNEFGAMFGLTQQSVSDLESGRKNPSKTLMAFLEYRYSDIFGSPETKTSDENTKGEQPSSISSVSVVVSEHQDMVKKFKNPEKAKEINEDLLVLEEIDQDGFDEVHEIIKRKIERKNPLKKTRKIRKGPRKIQTPAQKNRANGN